MSVSVDVIARAWTILYAEPASAPGLRNGIRLAIVTSPRPFAPSRVLLAAGPLVPGLLAWWLFRHCELDVPRATE
jgi:hypothetical protein